MDDGKKSEYPRKIGLIHPENPREHIPIGHIIYST
jgi:hypothetical protein